jgi:membrane-associated phospholipid phosphatase
MRALRLFGLLVLLGGFTAAQAQGAAIVKTLHRLGDGTAALPRTAAHHWRAAVIVTATTAALIAFADQPASARIDSPSLERWSNNWSNRGLVWVEPALILGLTSFEAKCLFCSATGHMALVTLSAEAYATASVQTLKLASGRERPYLAGDGDGGFNESGSSFPSGHATGAFTMASVFTHEFPHSTWAGWAAYGSAAGVSGLRFTAKRHFPSDLLAGATLGWLTGRCAVTCN